jgi:hypothetical protein
VSSNRAFLFFHFCISEQAVKQLRDQTDSHLTKNREVLEKKLAIAIIIQEHLDDSTNEYEVQSGNNAILLP